MHMLDPELPTDYESMWAAFHVDIVMFNVK